MTESMMGKLYDEIKENASLDAVTKSLWKELIERSVIYTEIRVKWGMLTAKERAEADAERTACHNSVIAQFNLLSDYLEGRGVEHSWHDEIGTDRRDIGDFSNYIIFREAVENR